MKQPWFAVRQDFRGHRSVTLKLASFLLPLALWCAVSYVPFIWHPMVKVTAPGDSPYMRPGNLVEREVFADENQKLRADGKAPAEGGRANPIFLPAPHEVVRSVYTAFTTPPRRINEPWLHESLIHSIKVISSGFSLAVLFGVPLGILAGTFAFFSRLIEPFVDFIRYLPPPVFGALMVAVWGIDDGPKIAIIFIGTVFQMIRVVANTTRLIDPALLEAAQTLGTSNRRLVTRVILPGILPNLYHDLRILLGAAWTLLTVAELIGATTGISYFINQQGKYRNYQNVFAGIAVIGMLGMITDKLLSVAGRKLFPWQPEPKDGFWTELWSMMWIPRRRERTSRALEGVRIDTGRVADADAAAV